MAANTNPTTGIPYGYISAHCLDNDLVNGLLYGEGVADFHNLSWESACEDYIAEFKANYEGDDDDMPDDDTILEDRKSVV